MGGGGGSCTHAQPVGSNYETFCRPSSASLVSSVRRSGSPSFPLSVLLANSFRLTLDNSQAIVLDDDTITPRRFPCLDASRELAHPRGFLQFRQRQSPFFRTLVGHARPREKNKYGTRGGLGKAHDCEPHGRVTKESMGLPTRRIVITGVPRAG